MRWIWAVALCGVVLGVLAWWPSEDPVPRHANGVRLVVLDDRGSPVDNESQKNTTLRDTLAQAAPETFVAGLRAQNLDGVEVATRVGHATPPDASVAERMSAGAYVEGMKAGKLGAPRLVYTVRDLTLPREAAEKTLARAARVILAGSQPPPESAFPSSLRVEQPVEVLVALREGRLLRLWRSARARSVPAGLSLAAVAARDRWNERAATMGGPLSQRLGRLTVEVWLLLEDGDFTSSAEPALDRWITPVHGVGFEEPSRWRYLLPGEVRTFETGRAALESLFVANDLPVDKLLHSDRRVYRFVAKTVSVDPPSGAPSSEGG